MARILFLAHRIPYPPNKGDKIRSWNILSHLAKTHEVHLGAFIDDPADWQHADVLRSICAETHFVALSPLKSRLRSLRSLFKGEALSLGHYWSNSMAAWVSRKLTPISGIDRVFLFSSPMAQFVLGKTLPTTRVVMDFVDVDSDKWAQYSRNNATPMRWVYRHEARKLLQFERKVAAHVDASIFVSSQEAALFRALAPESADKVFAVNNGVDHDYFSPDRPYETPFAPKEIPLVFTGAMDYWANAQAVLWFSNYVFPRIQTRAPAVHFYIVGGKPPANIKALGARHNVTVTGAVPDIRPYLAHAKVVVAPLRIARGVQNKVLEGMAMAKPVVATSQAADGIDCRRGMELIVAEGEDEFASACLDALNAPEDDPLKARARARVIANYDWQHNLAEIPHLLKLDEQGRSEGADYETVAAS